MFKNIELSEINKENVVQSLWLLIGLSAAFILILFMVELAMSKGGLNLGFVFYGILQIIFYAWPFWGTLLLVLFLTERLVLGKRSTTKTVRKLFLFEMLLPVILLLSAIFLENLDLMVLSVTGSVFLSQWIRWNFLKRDNRMYNYVNKNLQL